MDRFLDAYQEWPSGQQLSFALVVVLVVSILIFIGGWWLVTFLSQLIHNISIWLRGWPPPSSVGPAPVPRAPEPVRTPGSTAAWELVRESNGHVGEPQAVAVHVGDDDED